MSNLSFSQVGIQLIQATIVVIVLPLIKRWVDERARPKRNVQARLEQLSSLLAFDVRTRSRIIIEHHFQGFFKVSCDFDEIVCLLEARAPLRAFTLLRRARGFVSFDTDRTRFRFRDAYQSPQQRSRRYAFWFVAYATLGYLTVLPLQLAMLLREKLTDVAPLLIAAPFSLLAALVCLSYGTSMKKAVDFIAAAEPASAVSGPTAPVGGNQAFQTDVGAAQVHPASTVVPSLCSHR